MNTRDRFKGFVRSRTPIVSKLIVVGRWRGGTLFGKRVMFLVVNKELNLVFSKGLHYWIKDVEYVYLQRER